MISPRVITAESINFMKLKKLSEEQKLKEKSYPKKETSRHQTPLVISQPLQAFDQKEMLLPRPGFKTPSTGPVFSPNSLSKRSETPFNAE